MSNFSDFRIWPRRNQKFETLRGSGSCVAGNVVRFNFTIIETDKGLFATFPERTYKDKNGETKRVKEVGIPDTKVYTEFQKAVRAAYEDTVNKDMHGEEPQVNNDPADDDVPF